MERMLLLDGGKEKFAEISYLEKGGREKSIPTTVVETTFLHGE